MKDRFEIAADLRAIANLLRIKGENPFKAQAYERGAGILENLEGDLNALVKERRLKEFAGIGTALAATIEEIHGTGECWLLQQLREELPRGAVELSEIPGLSLKKIIALDEALHIETIADLKSACQEGLVSKVKGFGLKSQAKLLADIEDFETPKDGFLLLHAAFEEADRIIKHLRGCPELIEADVAGALRRRKETIREISIIAASDRPKAVLDQFLRYPVLARTDELDDVHRAARLASGIRAEVVIVRRDNFIAALHARTGSGKHLDKLQHLARGQGINFLNGEPGNGSTEAHVKEESEIYRRLGLQYIAPELREDEGEIEAGRATKWIPIE
jgi:DNA polymerase (family 10)